MTKVNLTTNASYNFVAPAILADSDKKIEVPFPTQGTVEASLDENSNLSIERAFTHAKITVEADLTLTGVLGSSLKIGDIVLLSATASGANRTLTLAANLGGKAIVLTEDQQENILLVCNGTSFEVVAFGDGADGADGADGKSAYEIWLDEGNVGDEAAFLASLKGDQGDPGVGMSFEKQTPDFAAAIEIVVDQGKTLFLPGQLTDDVAITADVTAAVAGAEIHGILQADALGNKTATFGAGFDAASITVQSNSKAGFTAIFDGTKFYIVSITAVL